MTFKDFTERTKDVIIFVEDGVVQGVYNLPEDLSYEVLNLDAERPCDCAEGEHEWIGDNPLVNWSACLTCGGNLDLKDYA
jgi:hypothetical protein